MKVIRLHQLMTDGIRQQKSGQFGKKLRSRQARGWQCWGKGGTTRLLSAWGHAGSQTKPSCLLSPRAPSSGVPQVCHPTEQALAQAEVAMAMPTGAAVAGSQLIGTLAHPALAQGSQRKQLRAAPAACICSFGHFLEPIDSP